MGLFLASLTTQSVNGIFLGQKARQKDKCVWITSSDDRYFLSLKRKLSSYPHLWTTFVEWWKDAACIGCGKECWGLLKDK